MDFIQFAVPLIPLFPLGGALILGLFGKKIQASLGESLTGILGCAAPLFAAALAFASFFLFLGLPIESRLIRVDLAPWVSVADFQIAWAFRYDALSAFMLLIITGIGSLIHIYSLGYMQGDRSFWRFFSYINLFLGAMLLLVLGDNLLVMFLGWEGVGLCSYLLIGFWFDHTEYAAAGKKAFLFNRIGDLGFLVGVILLVLYSSLNWDVVTLSFSELQDRTSVLARFTVWQWPLLEVVAISFFIGAMGKSAQFPLYVWLPDAMAGPTPVSALIHAATMVTAGVYMIGRMFFIYSAAPHALGFIALIAGITCLLAATIGMAQHDIKKVLAYSTVSQLGYMFIAMGAGAFSYGLFHLLTHAAFKAALFMGAGSVIIALHHEQDMRKMGGLLKKMPITGYSFIAATLAIMGFPLTSGFFSKDEILEAAFTEAGVGIWALGFIAAGITSFYMWRLVFMTFFGQYRGEEQDYERCREQPKKTVLPIAILAAAALLLGFLNVPDFMGGGERFSKYLQPVVVNLEDQAPPLPAHAAMETAPSTSTEQPALEDHDLTQHPGPIDHTTLEWSLTVATVLWSFFTAFLAWYFYLKNPQAREKLMSKASPQALFTLLNNKYFVDELYDTIIVEPLQKLYRFLAKFDQLVVDGMVNGAGHLGRISGQVVGLFDNKIIDGIVNEVAWFCQLGGRGFSLMQSGRIQALVGASMLLFATAITLLILFLG